MDKAGLMIQSYPANAATEQIKQLGLLEAAHRYGITTENNRWNIPIYEPLTGERFYRLRLRQVNKKLAWGGQSVKGKHPSMLISALPAFRSAVTASGGVVYLAAGEKDFLAYVSAGIENALYLVQEIPNPDILRHILDGVNAARVIYAPDRDETGMKSAAKIRDVCLELGIHYEPLELPFEMGSKKDTFDYWQLVADEDFRSKLDELPELALPAPEPKRTYQARQDYSTDGLQLYERWVNEFVKPALDINAPILKPYRGDGWRRFRAEDNTPSFRISYERSALGVPIDAGGALSWGDIASQLNVPPFAEWVKSILPPEKVKQRKKTRKVKTPTRTIKRAIKRASSLSNAVQVSAQYMSDVDIPQGDGVICYRGDMGNGKTHYIINNELPGTNTSLYLSPNLKPIENVCEAANKAGIPVHHHGQIRENADLRRHSHLATTPYQLHKLIDIDYPRLPDVLIIDEVETLLKAFYGNEAIWQRSGGHNTDKNKKQCLAAFEYFIKYAKRIIILDAFLNDKVVEHIKALRGADDIHVIENTYARQRGEKTIYKHPDNALDTGFRQWKKTGGRIAYCHNSKRDAIQTREILIRHYNIDPKSIFIITANTSGTDAVKEFVKNPDAYLNAHPEIKHLIYNEALGIGFSIETEFEVMVGIYNSKPLTHSSNLQMENRVRKVNHYHVYIAGNSKTPLPETPETIYQYEFGRAKLTAGIAGYDEHGIPVLEKWQSKVLKMKSKFEALSNASFNHLREYYIRDSEGHSEIRFDDNARGNADLNEIRKHLCADTVEREIEGVLSAKPIDRQSYDEITQNGEITDEMEHSLLRWEIEHVLGKSDLSKPDVKRYRLSVERSALRQYIDIHHEELETLKKIDRRQAKRTTHAREHRSLKATTLKHWETLFFSGSKANPDIEFEREYVEQKADDFITAFPDWKTRLGVRFDKSITLLSIAKRLFKLMGLKLTSRNTTGAGKVQRRVYSLDENIFLETERNAQTAYAARVERRIEREQYKLEIDEEPQKLQKREYISFIPKSSSPLPVCIIANDPYNVQLQQLLTLL